MKVFRHNKSKGSEESKIANDYKDIHALADTALHVRLNKGLNCDRKGLNFAQKYKEMCLSLKQFAIDSRKYDSNLERALVKYLPSAEFKRETGSRDPASRFNTTNRDSEGDGKNVDRRAAMKFYRIHSDKRLDEHVYPLENISDIEKDLQKFLPVQTPEFLQMDNLDFEVPYWRKRSEGNLIDVHELSSADRKDRPLSPYCQKYLELASYIPPLAVLCRAAIKNIISPMRTDATLADQAGFSNLRDLVCLPDWLEHTSLSSRIPQAARYQLLNIMLKQNCNNNHPSTPGGPEDQLIIRTKSKCPSTGSVPVNCIGAEEKKSTGMKVSSTGSIPVGRSSLALGKRSTGSAPFGKAGTKLRVDPSRITKGLERRKTEMYYLVPVGSCSLLGLSSKGVQTWIDVASIIHQGTYTHKNLDSKRLPKQALHTTLPAGMLTSVLVKTKMYSVRPIRSPMTSLKTLLDINATTRLFSETHAKFVAVNLLLALEFLHRHDVFHGSISPKKVIFNDKGYPCLTGFGAAEIIDDRQGRPRERTELTYSSPEQLYFEYITELTDIWSLGVLVYAMVYGKPPHLGKDHAETRRNISNHKFTPVFAPEEISSEAKSFISKCMRKDERRRLSLLHMKRSVSESIPWFARLNEDKLYRQIVPSPVLTVITNIDK